MRDMDALKTFLRRLPDEDSRSQFAVSCETTLGHLRNVMYGQKPCSPLLAAQLEAHTAGAVTRRDLRPDDWHRIWPELVTPEHPAPVVEAKAAA